MFSGHRQYLTVFPLVYSAVCSQASIANRICSQLPDLLLGPNLLVENYYEKTIRFQKYIQLKWSFFFPENIEMKICNWHQVWASIFFLSTIGWWSVSDVCQRWAFYKILMVRHSSSVIFFCQVEPNCKQLVSPLRYFNCTFINTSVR